MKLGSLIAASAEILNNFFIAKQPLNNIIKAWGKANRYAGSSDRRKIADIGYNVLRSYDSFKALAETSQIESIILVSLLCGKNSMSYEELEQELKSNAYACHLLQYLPTNFIDYSKTEKTAKDAIANIPDWQKSYFIKSFGANWVQEAHSLSSRPPIDVRINSLKNKSEEVKTIFALKTINIALPNALRLNENERVAKKQNLTNLEQYKNGYFEIQDVGSQYIAALVNAKPHMQILDYCAGAGGKSLSLAADMQNKGKIFAYDKYINRLEPIKERIKRATANIIEPIKDIKDLKPNMDIVVVDAPCSGSGIWRRFPDQKYLLQEKTLKNIVQTQYEILTEASKYVAIGGYLCYMTCSLFTIENDEQIERFLANNVNFELDTTKICKLTYPRYNNKYGISLTPFKSNSDGFYFAALKRIF